MTAHNMVRGNGKFVPSLHFCVGVTSEWRDEKIVRTAAAVTRLQVRRGTRRRAATTTYHEMPELLALLDEWLPQRGEKIVWVLHGWQDFVLSGLADAVDAGEIEHQHCSLGGERLLLRCTRRGRRFLVSSLAQWSDGDIIRASAKTAAQRSDAMARVVGDIAVLQNSLLIPRCKPTPGSAGLAVWTAWMGPPVVRGGGGGRRKAKADETVYVAPLLERPEPAAAAESHVCYGLMRRHLYTGRIDGPIYEIDYRSAYLAFLQLTRIPLAYNRTIRTPSVETVAENLDRGQALALVQVASETTPYPLRVKGRVGYGVGTFWTWLCGADLASALVQNHVQAVEVAHIWQAARLTPHAQHCCRQLSEFFASHPGERFKGYWRTIYSALVGKFAGRQKKWVDTDRDPRIDRWGTWYSVDAETGGVDQYRSIAGRAQRLEEIRTNLSGCPLLYGVVTATGRHEVLALGDACGHTNVVAVNQDAVMITQTGYDKLQQLIAERQGQRIALAAKAVYDRVWLTDGTTWLSESGGDTTIHVNGFPAQRESVGGAKVNHPVCRPWYEGGTPSWENGVAAGTASVSIDKIRKRWHHQPRWRGIAEAVHLPHMREELLQPLLRARYEV